MADESRVPKLETLLNAAAATFAARGYGGTSMRDIAHDSGISLSGIYYYTRGKAALLYEIQSRTVDALLASSAQATSSAAQPQEQLLRFIQNHITYMNEHPAFVRVLSHEDAEGTDDRREVIAARRREYTQQLRDILRRIPSASQTTSADFAADMLFAMMSGPNQWGNTGTALDPTSMGRAVYDLFLSGYAPGADRST